MYMSDKELKQLCERNPQLKHKFPEFFTSPKPTKYKNSKVYVYANGYTSFGYKETRYGKCVDVFDSIKEYERWHELRVLATAGIITDLQRQVKLIIQPTTEYNGQKVREIAYKADFMYQKDGHIYVEDVKPYDTRSQRYRLTKDFSLKWKMLKALYPHYMFVIY